MSASPSAIISAHLQSLILPITRATFTLPITRIRIIQQTHDSSTKKPSDHDEHTSRTAISIWKRIIKEEGILSLWKGFSAQLANVFIIRYASGPISRFVSNTISSTSPLIVYIVNSLLTYPFEQCKTILLVGDKSHCSNEKPFYSGMIDYFIRRTNDSGVASHYHGFLIHAFGSIMYTRIFFLIFDTFTNMRPLYIGKIPTWSVIIFEIIRTQICIVSASALTYPLDTISRKLQLQGCKKLEERKFTNSIQCAKKIIKEEGFSSLYQGFQTHCFSSFSFSLVSLFLNSVFGIH